MKAAIGCLIGLTFVVSASAEPLLEGRVRLESGEPVADAQVRLFDLTDLRQGAVARAQTDDRGYFALPLAALRGSALPEGFALGPNYPNPFNPSTIIPYQLAASSEVRLEVFNLLGQRIATLVDGERPAGFHTATWTATDAAGRAVGAGVYIYRMTVGVESQTGRMVLIDGQAGVAAGGAASVWSGASGGGRSDGASEHVYELIVSGEGLVPYVDSSFRVEVGMAPVELVVSAGEHSAGKVTDLFDALNDAEEEEETGPSGKAQATLDAPTAPTNLRFEAVTDSSCRVRWDAAAGATDYDVNYKPAVGGKWTNEPHKGVRLYNTIYDLEPETEYRWAARAENRDGASAWVFGPNFTTLPEDEADETLEDEADETTQEEKKEGPDALVTIPDATLRAVVEWELGKARGAPISVAEMKTLTKLESGCCSGVVDVSDLTGLEFATNLTDFSFYNHKITDISALSGLTNLKYIELAVNGITDISALSGLTNLEILWLNDNGITDISALSGLTNLRELHLSRNEITDISALSGLVNLIDLKLQHNSITDLAPLVANRGLGTDSGWGPAKVWVNGNPLSSTSIDEYVPMLRDRGVRVSFGEVMVFREPEIYNDNVFVLPVKEDLAAGGLPLTQYATRFYEYFSDAFDFLIFAPSLYFVQAQGPIAFYTGVGNDVQGIGEGIFFDGKWGSAEKLQGVIYIKAVQGVVSDHSELAGGVVLHELMHRWANFIVQPQPNWDFSNKIATSLGQCTVSGTGRQVHWDFTSANGILGGFDMADLVDHGGGRYSALHVYTGGFAFTTKPYSPIELYLAGLIPPEEVPDLWAAMDGGIRPNADGTWDNRSFAASLVKTYTIEDIIAEHGPRVPDYMESQRAFRAAVILLVSEDYPATREFLETLSADASQFSHAGRDGFYWNNFYEATGGRATMAMDGLSQFKHHGSAKRVVPKSFGTPPPPIVFYRE